MKNWYKFKEVDLFKVIVDGRFKWGFNINVIVNVLKLIWEIYIV